MTSSINFQSSHPNTLGIELELQIVDPVTFDLTGRSAPLLAQLADHPMAERIKPEITRAMIELNSSVHEHPAGLLAEMREMRDALCEAAHAVGVRIAGGGTHPFMNWQDCSIFDSPRFQYVAEMYGYLARQFTVFGQHIHLGVTSGDAAVSLTHRLSPYIPHFIALSSSSPYSQGADTLFSCSRLNALSSFPMQGHIPAEVNDWYAFEAYFAQLRTLGLAENLKDLYWDIRPKPEYGTVEIRACDTPLTVEKACQLAAFAQALAVLVEREPQSPPPEAWLAYDTNRFQACRFGLQAAYVQPDGTRTRLLDHLRQTFERLAPVADELGTSDLLAALHTDALLGNDSRWLRNQYNLHRNLPGVVRAATHAWSGVPLETAEAVGPALTANPLRRRVRASSEPLPTPPAVMLVDNTITHPAPEAMH